jgi:hypothetical protein
MPFISCAPEPGLQSNLPSQGPNSNIGPSGYQTSHYSYRSMCQENEDPQKTNCIRKLTDAEAAKLKEERSAQAEKIQKTSAPLNDQEESGEILKKSDLLDASENNGHEDSSEDSSEDSEEKDKADFKSRNFNVQKPTEGGSVAHKDKQENKNASSSSRNHKLETSPSDDELKSMITGDQKYFVSIINRINNSCFAPHSTYVTYVSCDSDSAENWDILIKEHEPRRIVQFRTRAASQVGGGKCLESNGDSDITLKPCADQDQQKFIYSPNEEVEAVFYENLSVGKCLSSKMSGATEKVVLENCQHSKQGQRFGLDI